MPCQNEWRMIWPYTVSDVAVVKYTIYIDILVFVTQVQHTHISNILKTETCLLAI